MARSLSISSPAAERPEASSSSVFLVRRPTVPHPSAAGGFEGPPVRQPAASPFALTARSGVLQRRPSASRRGNRRTYRLPDGVKDHIFTNNFDGVGFHSVARVPGDAQYVQQTDERRRDDQVYHASHLDRARRHIVARGKTMFPDGMPEEGVVDLIERALTNPAVTAAEQNRINQDGTTEVNNRPLQHVAGEAVTGRADGIRVEGLFQDGELATVYPVLQAKLRVSDGGDPLEREADRIAEHVMSPSYGPGSHGDAGRGGETRAAGAPSASVSEGPGRAVLANAGQGQALPSDLRSDYETRFGQDFSRIRVHTDGAAAKSAEAFDARAYALGPHIVFGAGEFQPASSQGRMLIAHELCHTIQQGGGGEIRRQEAPGPPKGHIDLSLDPRKPQEFLKRLGKFVEQQKGADLKRGAPDPGHVTKLKNAMGQVKKLQRAGKISKKIARAARGIVRKAGLPAMILLALWPEGEVEASQNPASPDYVPPEKDWLDHVGDFLDEIDPFHVKPAY